LQSYFAACEDETPAIRNHDKVLQRLCEHLDHALLYGLQDLSSGYWVLVVHFTRREAIKQIEVLQHVATNLGRSRAWLYLALNENSLESYLRLFQENLSLLHKYYVKNALVCSHDHLTLFLTLVSGLEFIRFDLDLVSVLSVFLGSGSADYYKPQYLLDFEDRLPSSVHGSDSLSLNSFNSVTSTNLEWDDSAIAPSSEDGDLTDTLSCPRSTASEANDKELKAPSAHTQGWGHPKTSPAGQCFVLAPCFSREELGHVAPRSPADAREGEHREQDLAAAWVPREASTLPQPHPGVPSLHLPLLAGRDTACPPSPFPASRSQAGISPTGQEEGRERSALSQLALRIPEMKDTSMESVGQPLSKVMDRLNGQLDPAGWNAPLEPPGQSFRTGTPGETPDGSSSGDFSEGISAPMDFYRFTVESPNAAAPGGGHHDAPGPGQPPHVSGSPEAAEEEESREGEAVGAIEGSGGANDEPQTAQTETANPMKMGHKGGRGAGSMGAQMMAKFNRGGDCPSWAAPRLRPSSTVSPRRVDNNHLLLLMIHVFRENEEQLFRMIRMSTGHMEGNLQLIYVLLTDCYVYLIRKGAAGKPYMVEEAVSYNELDYVSVGLDQQTVTLVCTNRRKQFLLDTADVALTEFFLVSLKSAMIKGCREP
ncbi:Pleckstrin homology domain-containing family M member 2, partial [Podiceps cristatus]